MTASRVWQVLYADWQMECCGTPFAVGDEVAWPLLVQTEGVQEWEAEFSTIEGAVVALDSLPGEWSEEDEGAYEDEGEDFEDAVEPSVVRAHGVTVPWNRARPWPGRAGLTGLLSVERHGGRWPDTVGTVRAIHVVTQGFAETSEGSRTYEPVPGERWLRPVELCPKWFQAEELSRTSAGPGYHRGETGVLVELEVTEPGEEGAS
ncbi:DUF6578 domain-containing protein [Streptomyces sp. NPDC059002]|uniref:DUF6578 domain-containing protein n=1 Tax=Streptomyces sp. NPDC059002 TaxID=3346690 RepID=UPI0036B9A0B9